MNRIIAIAAAICILITAMPVSSETLYKDGDFDESKCQLSGNPRDDIVGIAMTQIGYHEGDCDAEKTGFNSDGGRNFTKYSEYSGFDDAWCAMFIVWCARKANIGPESGILDSSTCAAVANNGNCFNVTLKHVDGFVPQKGDLVFFDSKIKCDDWTGRFSATAHVGLIVNVEDGRIFTVEGNTSDSVQYKSYPLNHSRIVGYGVPYYDNDVCHSDGASGKYVVTARKTTGKGYANVKLFPLDSTKRIGKIPEKSIVDVVSSYNGYACVKGNNGYGWIRLEDIYPLSGIDEDEGKRTLRDFVTGISVFVFRQPKLG